MTVASFIVCLSLFVIIGVFSTLKNKNTNEDYLLAGQNVAPWLAGLSAVATNNSGFMFIGMIGYTYSVGLSSVWLMIGWVTGDFIASLIVHKKLRIMTEAQGSLSFTEVISRWNGVNYKGLRAIGGLMTVLFLGTYAAAQLNAGSKALHVLFGWDITTGAIIGAFMVLVYCFAGGIRASIWTDAAQSFVMLVAMVMLFFIAVNQVGGWQASVSQLDAVSPTFLSLMPQGLAIGGLIGAALHILGWCFAGYGVVGQPHIMVRFMALNKPGDIVRARIYYYGWFTLFYGLTIGVGLMARLLVGDTSNFDAELALPLLAQDMLPEILVGLVLAGLFAATMSTADSQILSCTAAITRDLLPRRESYVFTKLVTVGVTFTALAIALAGPDSVFELVLISWSALACAFAPLLTVYALGGRVPQSVAIAMIIAGEAGMFLWRYSGLQDTIYEVLPGTLAGLSVYLIARLLTKKPVG